MNLTITNKHPQPLLHRTEITARMHFEDAMPSRHAVADAVASELKAKRELIIVRQIKPVFGETAAHLRVHQYDSEEIMATIERENMVAKNVKPAKVPEPEPVEAATVADAPASEDSSDE